MEAMRTRRKLIMNNTTKPATETKPESCPSTPPARFNLSEELVPLANALTKRSWRLRPYKTERDATTARIPIPFDSDLVSDRAIWPIRAKYGQGTGWPVTFRITEVKPRRPFPDEVFDDVKARMYPTRALLIAECGSTANPDAVRAQVRRMVDDLDALKRHDEAARKAPLATPLKSRTAMI